MTLRIGDLAPDFTADSTEGTIQDFAPVCTTELGYLAGLLPQFAARGCRVIGLSADPVESHEAWKKDIHATQGHAVRYPLIAPR